MRENLPHLYGFDWYPYQKKFIATNKEWQFLCCANQLGKTTSLCAKLTDLATDQDRWKQCWVTKPRLFLYLLPNQKIHNENAESKWLDVLPKNEMQHHEYYGWEWEKRGKDYLGINFKNGVRIRFLSYGQSVHSLQNFSAHVIAFDEEPPWEMVPEVQTRTQAIRIADANIKNAYGGFKIFAFTATKSQNYFREILEERGEAEKMPVSQGNVFKLTVSLYDCQKHVSGAKSQWTNKKIQNIINTLPTEAEIKRRVYGRFQASEGLVYQNFEYDKNTTDSTPIIPNTWDYYVGIDWGAGGTSHPSAIVTVAVNEDYNFGYVVNVWRGEGELTTCGDVVDKYIDMTRGLEITGAYYDWAAKDLQTIAMRRGISFIKANKNRKIGQDMLNGLFKSKMLVIPTITFHCNQLASELSSLVVGSDKKGLKVQDHLTDALRYAISSIPWDFSNPRGIKEIVKEVKQHKKGRLGRMYASADEEDDGYTLEGEFHEWQEMFGDL